MIIRRLNAITLNSCQAIRSMTSNFMGDALFYFTAYHGQRIISAVVELMNNAYNEYISQHSDFKGKVILFGHSLGGVILYDILVNQDFKKLESFRAYDKPEDKTKNSNIPLSPNGNYFSETEEIFTKNEFSNTSNVTDNDSFDSINLTESQVERKLYFGDGEVVFPSINFYPDFFYVCGSSISAAMIMRCQYYQNYHLPEHMVFQNIYNRTDPFAYRYEPMVDEDLQYVKPVFIKNININSSVSSNVDYDSTGQNTPRSAGSNPPSLFVSLRERFSNKRNHSPSKSKSYPEPKRQDSEKSPKSPETQDIDKKEITSPFIDNTILSPKFIHSSDINGDIDTDLCISSPSSPALSSTSTTSSSPSTSSSNSPVSKRDDRSESSGDKRKITESPSFFYSEEAQANGKPNEIQQYRCASPENVTINPEKRFISTQGPRDLLSSSLSRTQITNTTVTIPPTSPKISALENTKKKTVKRFPSFMTSNSSSESKKKNSNASVQKRNSESKLPYGEENVNIPLPDGRIAFENHPLLKYRVDYVLQENISDVIKGSYVAALGAHTSYW
ncbi:hypothetical protein PIROE2DRAFT_57273 [Piromyces sp. E2]|nr:hypothetical protein PIROE2DRAFT_57273 [Piromyces sp. E2]|eukprot:OUM69733.1 hypothetical protein PIROE2DRAFT_57273 [Piromyces sp. E2]